MWKPIILFWVLDFLRSCNRKLRWKLFDTRCTLRDKHFTQTFRLSTVHQRHRCYCVALRNAIIPMPNRLVCGTETEKSLNSQFFQSINLKKGKKKKPCRLSAEQLIIISAMLQAERKGNKAEGVNRWGRCNLTIFLQMNTEQNSPANPSTSKVPLRPQQSRFPRQWVIFPAT